MSNDHACTQQVDCTPIRLLQDFGYRIAGEYGSQ